MSSIVAEPQLRTVTAQPIFTDRSRWLAAVVLVIGPLLQAIEFLLENPPDDTAARLASWAADPGRIGMSQAAGLLAVPFLLGGVAVLIALTRGRSPRLAWVAGALMTCAMVGLAAVHGVEIAAYGLARSGNLAAAKAVLEAADLGLPFAVLGIMFFGGAVFGTLALAAAAWRSPLVPQIVPLFILAFAVLDFAAGQGVVSHLVNLVGFSVVAAGVVGGYSRPAHSTVHAGSGWR